MAVTPRLFSDVGHPAVRLAALHRRRSGALDLLVAVWSLPADGLHLFQAPSTVQLSAPRSTAAGTRGVSDDAYKVTCS